MGKKDKALEYYDYLVKMNPNKSVELKFFIRVYDEDCVEASYQPFILDKKCVFSEAVYVLCTGSGFQTRFVNKHLYFDNIGETFEYAPYNDGKLIIEKRQSQAGFEGRGYYDCSYNRNGLRLEYHGYPEIDFLSFYRLFLSYAKMVENCSSQSEVDYLDKCLNKDLAIEKIKIEDIAKEAKISRLEDLIEAHQDFIAELKSLLDQKNI